MDWKQVVFDACTFQHPLVLQAVRTGSQESLLDSDDRHRVSFSSAVISHISFCLNTGLLALPFALRCETLYAITALFCLASFSLVCSFLVLRAFTALNATSLRDLARLVLGERGFDLFACLYLLYWTLSAVISLLACGEGFSVIAKGASIRKGIWIVISIAMMMPFTWVRDPSKLSATPYCTFGLTVFTVAALLIRLIFHSDGELEKIKYSNDMREYFWIDFAKSAGIMVIGFPSSLGAIQIRQAVVEPQAYKVLILSHIALFCIYGSIACLGYGQFGEDSRDNILENITEQPMLRISMAMVIIAGLSRAALNIIPIQHLSEHVLLSEFDAIRDSFVVRVIIRNWVCILVGLFALFVSSTILSHTTGFHISYMDWSRWFILHPPSCVSFPDSRRIEINKNSCFAEYVDLLLGSSALVFLLLWVFPFGIALSKRTNCI